MAGVPIWQVDAFTERPFAGNPAAICLLEEKCDAAWMQSVAAEMNLSETAFVRRLADGFQLRWFTPAIEVDLCGHATLAAAYALWTAGVVSAQEPIRFHTLSGVLTASRDGELIRLDFPATPAEACSPPDGLLESLGVEPTFVGKTQSHTVLLVASAPAVRAMKPDFRGLTQVAIRSVMVTAVSDDGRFDFISRYFAPSAGIDEDPVTGSAHCCLGPFWGERLGKAEMVAFQASSRGGVVHVQLKGDRVILGGRAVLVLKGELV